jgi:hypothetical protein
MAARQKERLIWNAIHRNTLQACRPKNKRKRITSALSLKALRFVWFLSCYSYVRGGNGLPSKHHRWNATNRISIGVVISNVKKYSVTQISIYWLKCPHQFHCVVKLYITSLLCIIFYCDSIYLYTYFTVIAIWRH